MWGWYNIGFLCLWCDLVLVLDWFMIIAVLVVLVWLLGFVVRL